MLMGYLETEDSPKFNDVNVMTQGAEICFKKLGVAKMSVCSFCVGYLFQF